MRAAIETVCGADVRLTAVEAPDKVAAELMGHKYHWPRYGVGPSLAKKRE